MSQNAVSKDTRCSCINEEVKAFPSLSSNAPPQQVMTTTTIECIPKTPIVFTIGWAGDQTGKPICHRLHSGFVAHNKTSGWQRSLPVLRMQCSYAPQKY
jgi:hypothetical protein